MNPKDVLLIKIETLRQSISDNLIDSVLALIKETVEMTESSGKEIGFKVSKKD